ncbi:MAG: MoaD/ThiS family protein [Anaerolineae bacterium]|nr:MoaD/ThiS family protein [Anaerolineae bacterium]
MQERKIVIIEFTGLSRQVVGQKQIAFDLPAGATYGELVRELGARYPDFIGLLIDTDGETLMSGNMLIINGDLATPAFVMDEAPADGDRLVFMSLVTGG